MNDLDGYQTVHVTGRREVSMAMGNGPLVGGQAMAAKCDVRFDYNEPQRDGQYVVAELQRVVDRAHTLAMQAQERFEGFLSPEPPAEPDSQCPPRVEMSSPYFAGIRMNVSDINAALDRLASIVNRFEG